VERVKTAFRASVFAIAVTMLWTGCNRVSWPVSRELCGQIRILDKQTKTMLRNTDLILYRSNSKYSPCCAKAQKAGEVRTDDQGNFNSGKLQAGRYFVVVKDSPEIAFPVFLEEDSRCENCGLNTVFSFDRQTGKTEQTVTVLIYSK
jgi:hypothetical protein